MHPSRRHRPYRVAFVLIALVLAILAVALPFALQSVIEDVMEPPEGAVFTVAPLPGAPLAATSSRLHVSLVDIDEARLLATLRVSGHHACDQACPYAERVLFFSLATDEAATAGIPPSATVDLASPGEVVTSTLTLPLRGNPSRYPFDTYELLLGVGLAQVPPGGTPRPVSRAEGAGHLALTLQEQLPRETMSAPQALDPDTMRDYDDPYELQTLHLLQFARPTHTQVLAVLLVVLIAAAAAYAVFMRPLHDLVINSGALVLGVWGIRSILTPGTAYRTLVDLALSAVILFLLGAITYRALEYCYAQGGFRPLGRWGTHNSEVQGATCDYPDCPNPIARRCETCGQTYCPRHISAGATPTCDACASEHG